MPTLRQIAASYWTAAAAGGALMVVHAWWLSRSDHAGEVLSGLGAAVVVLGIWVAARPYIRNGLQPVINAGLPAYGGGFYGSNETIARHRDLVEQMRPIVERDVWAERIVAVAVIVIGTLLNGYGAPIARTVGWPT